MNPDILRKAKETARRLGKLANNTPEEPTPREQRDKATLTENAKQAREKALGRPLTYAEKKAVERVVEKQYNACGGNMDNNEVATMNSTLASATETELKVMGNIEGQAEGPVSDANSKIAGLTKTGGYNPFGGGFWDSKKISEQTENALSTGAVKADLDPETGEYTIMYMTKDGWKTDGPFKDAEVAKRKLRAHVKNDVPKELKTGLSEDLKTAVATGDVQISPTPDGKSLKYYTPDGGPFQTTPQEAIENLNNDPAVQDYQNKNGVKWTDVDGVIDGPVSDAVKDALWEQAATDSNGVKRCPSCGQVWESKGVRDAHEHHHEVLVVKPEKSILVKSTDKALLKERAALYKDGFNDWKKLDDVTSIISTILKVNKKIFSQSDIAKIMSGIGSVLLGDEKLLAKYRTTLVQQYASETNPIRRANMKRILEYLPTEVVNDPQPRAKVCPVCGKPVAPDDPIINPEQIYSKTNYKGPKDLPVEGFAGNPYIFFSGWEEMIRDGSQQGINPFTHPDSLWTRFSYRPSDKNLGFPAIRITPAAFESITSIEKILSDAPYMIITEYFMRNNVSNAMSMFQALTDKTDAEQQSADEANQVGPIEAKTTAIMDAVKKAILGGSNEDLYITIPFILYHRLKGKVYGNKYVFPYVPRDNSIAKSGNRDEWQENGGLTAKLANAAKNLGNMVVGGLGFGIAKPFPAPTWKLPDSGEKWMMQFTLNLINDDWICGRNNYMCTGTIINNNRWIQKGILGFPGALYEVYLPTGVRELMCTGQFDLKPLGVNRHPPAEFFMGGGGKYGNSPFAIGATKVVPPPNGELHKASFEVVPDAYALSCTLESAIAQNLNNSVFSYYRNIVDFPPGTVTDSAIDKFLSPEGEGAGNILLASADQHVVSTSHVAEGAAAAEKMINTIMGKAAEESAAEDAGKDDGGGDPGDGGEKGVRSFPKIPYRVKRRSAEVKTVREAPVRKLYVDEKSIMYRMTYEQLTDNLTSVRTQLSEAESKLKTLIVKRNSSRPGGHVRMMTKDIRSLQSDIKNFKEQCDKILDEMVKVEMEILSHAKESFSERMRQNTIGVPERYFEIPEIDEVEEIKIRCMTRAQRKKYIAEKRAEIARLDKYGITKCSDFLLRACVITYICDLLQEINEAMRDVEEEDPDQYDEYRYRRDMLYEDLKLVLNPDKPFILNKTNLVYIDNDHIPEELRSGLTDPDEVPLPEPVEPDEDGDEEGGESEPEPTPTPESVEEVNAEELIDKHKQDVIRLRFGSEDGLVSKAYEYVAANNSNGKAEIKILKELRSNPEYDSLPSGKTIVDLLKDWDPELKDWLETVNSETGKKGEDKFTDPTSRSQSIADITKELYFLIENARTVLLNNAMVDVDTIARLTLDKVTEEFNDH